ncbi:hypothetical protein BH10CYA1_BH10CYA1_04230 [soil metagenome]
MLTDQPSIPHRDAGDSLRKPGHESVGNIDVGLSNPAFNREYAVASQKSFTAILNDFSLTNSEGRVVSDRASQNHDVNNHTAVVKFKNIDASHHFARQTQEAFEESYGRLNPETQQKLAGLKVITASQAFKGLSGVPKDIPAVTPSLHEGKGNMMVFSEAGIKKDHAPIKDVMNHEIWHVIDNATGASNDPELRKAIDLGISRLSKQERREIAVHGKEQKDERYAEFAGDVMALEVGSKPKDLAYVTHLKNTYNNFKEARELMRKKFLREE